MLLRIFLLGISLILVKTQMTGIGDAIEAFRPCESGILFMERIIGGKPSTENYWDGSIGVAHKYPNLTEARLTLELNANAAVSVDPEEGRIITNSGGYHISYFRPEGGYNVLRFHVQAKPNQSFPNVKSLTLNGEDICPNPKEWVPSILGANQSIGSISIDDLANETTTTTCGHRKVTHQALITNGFPSNEGDWPWHTAIFHLDRRNSKSEYVCGGSLLTSKLVMTAAHCVVEGNQFLIPERILIILGLHNRVLSGRNAQQFRVFKIMPHENFNFNDLSNDIALIKLATEAVFTNYIQPVCLWRSNEAELNSVIDKKGTVIGWGFTSEDKLSDILTQAKMPVVSITTCLSSNRDFFGIFLSDNNFCAGFRNGTSVCNGDSGGGMIFKRDNSYYIRGIVSLTVSREDKEVCDTKSYVIFTDVAKYLGWIEDKLQQNS